MTALVITWAIVLPALIVPGIAYRIGYATGHANASEGR